MAFLSIPNVAIRGIAACVPQKVEENRDLHQLTNEDAQKLIQIYRNMSGRNDPAIILG